MKRKIIVAVTGASGSIYAKLLLQKLEHLNNQWDQVGIVMSSNAAYIWQTELDEPHQQYKFAQYYDKMDFTAPFASGSGQYDTLIIVPCSMGTLGRIAAGLSDDLLTRAADVILKERRKMICVLRETPYNLIQIQNMKTLTEAGAIICPATPSFYSKPRTIEEAALTVVDRVLDLAGFTIESYRWGKEH